MALKLIFCIAAIVACVHARPGGPAAYSISAPSVDHASVGSTQEHTVKGHYGQSSQSDYASQVQTAHSQSHVQRSSISNDAGLAPGHLVAAHAAPVTAHAAYAPAPPSAITIAAAAPINYAAHSYAPSAISLAHTGPAIASHGSIAYAAPAAAYGHGYASAAAPVPVPVPVHLPAVNYAATAPALHLTAAAPAPVHAIGYNYGGGVGVGAAAHYGAAPVPAYAHGYIAAAAPTLKFATAAAPAYAHGIIGHAGIGLAGPIAHGPAIAHLAAPTLLKTAVASPALVHTSVSGHGIQYGY